MKYLKKQLLLILILIGLSCAFDSCVKAPFITLSGPHSYSFTREGGSQSFSFSCNRDWGISSSESWVRISPSSGSASNEDITVTLTVDLNSTYDPRNATITVKVEGFMEAIAVTQESGEGLLVSPTLFELDNESQRIEIKIDKNVPYTVLIDEDCNEWVIQENTKSLSTDNLSFFISANYSYEPREGRIRITQTNGDLETVINIKQDRSYTIQFRDPYVKRTCVQHFDTNGDGEISFDEAASVKSIEPDSNYKRYDQCSIFTDQGAITSFNELQFFTSLTELPDHAFVGTRLEEVTLPDRIERIGASAFVNTRIKHIDFPNTLKTIGYMAFSGCDDLESVTIPASVQELFEAFWGSGISSIEALGDIIGGCRGCKNLKTVTIPANVKKIEAHAFMGCPLTEITIPNSVTNVGSFAFAQCNTLKDITIKNNIIGVGMFSGCAIETIVIPEHVEQIGAQAFTDCKELISITLPPNLEELGEGLFWGCEKLTSIIIPDKISEIPSATFADCFHLHEIHIKGALTSIGDSAFRGCSFIDFEYPSTLISLGSRAFQNSSIQKVVLPESLQFIGWGCFENCSLSYVICNALEPPVLETPSGFTFNGGSYPIYVPSVSVEKYKQESEWRLNSSRIFALEALK